MTRKNEMLAMSPQGAHHVPSTQAQAGEEDTKTNNHHGAITLDSSMMMDSRIRDDGGRNDANHSGEGKIRSTDFSALKIPFPWKLWQVLEDSERKGNESIVSWLPDGDGFSISKPSVFTNRIMKAYFALTTYDSFIQELLRYGFIRTTTRMVELRRNKNEERVDVFRNPRYNRKEKIQSLSIRRKSAVKSFSVRLSAKLKNQDKVVPPSSWWCSGAPPPAAPPSSSSNQDSQNPVFMSLATRNSHTAVAGGGGGVFNQNIYYHTTSAPHDLRPGVVEAKWNPLLCNNVGGKSVNHETSGIDYSFIDGYNIEDHLSANWCGSTTSSTSPIKFCELGDTYESPLSALGLDQVIMPLKEYPQEQQAFDMKNKSALPMGWVTKTTNHGHYDQSLGTDLQLPETNWNDTSCPETMHNATLTGRLHVSSSHSFSTMNSQVCKRFDNVEPPEAELEEILDEDIMESIFD